MLRFFSNSKVFGYYIIVICLLSVSANEQKWIKGTFNESSDTVYRFFKGDKPCLEERNGTSTHVEKIIFKGDCNVKHIDLKENNSAYKDLIKKVTIDCNGRPECTESYSGIKIPKPKCSREDYIHIAISCKPTNIDNITVFNIGLDPDFKQMRNGSYYLVLRLQDNKHTHHHCKIDEDQSGIKVTVLHVDFGPNSESNKINSDSLQKCHEKMTLVSKDRNTCNYTWNSSLTFQIMKCEAKHIDIDIYMSTGFVWIEIEGGKDFKLNCSGSNSNNHVTSHRPSSEMSHSPITKPTVTTDREPFDYVYNIIIPASVAFLALLIVIVSFVFCVCRRNSRFQVWRRSRGESAHCDRRDDEYDNVPSHEDLDPTYNIVNALVATDAKKRTRPVSNTTKPRVPSTAQQTPLKPIKTPTPTDSSGPSRKVEQQGEGAPDGANGDLYATVNKVKKVEAAASSGTSTNHGNITQANMADSDGAEYSHLANFGKKRNYENIYNG